jgi:hypothetical protein
MLVVAACLVAAPVPAAEGVAVRVEIDDGTAEEGRLVEIGAESLQVADAGGTTRSIPLERVRTVERRVDLPGGPSAAAESRVRVVLTDGTSLAGDDFAWSCRSPACGRWSGGPRARRHPHRGSTPCPRKSRAISS